MADKPSRQSHAGLDDSDLSLAMRELAAAREMMAAAHAVADRRESARAIEVAAGRLALASRAIEVVIDRRVRHLTTRSRL